MNKGIVKLSPSLLALMGTEGEQAIAIYWQDNQIGWVPQEWNLIISRLMDAGKAFFSRVEKTERKGNWLKINVKVYMVE